VKMAVLAPLLYLADFYLAPFHIMSEISVSFSDADEDTIIEGKIDVLVLKKHLWVVVIESKKAYFSVEAGLSQLLSYMLANPNHSKLNFGLITTGGSFVFVKMVKDNIIKYSSSRVFELRNHGNELYAVLSILKNFRNLFSEPNDENIGELK
jgi:hypothetical protein